MVVKPLSELGPGEKGKIVRIRGRADLHQRLSALGLVVGGTVFVDRRNISPMIEPIHVDIQIEMNGRHHVLCREMAASIYVNVAK